MIHVRIILLRLEQILKGLHLPSSLTCTGTSVEAEAYWAGRPARDRKGFFSQTELANKSGASRVMIGKYERGEAIPSIDAAKKIANALEASLDYLVGEGINSKLDKQALKRRQDLELREDDKRKTLYRSHRYYIRKAKARKAYGLLKAQPTLSRLALHFLSFARKLSSLLFWFPTQNYITDLVHSLILRQTHSDVNIIISVSNV